MHLITRYWDIDRFSKSLPRFSGGQFMMVTPEKTIFRGEISHCCVPSKENRRVFVFFNWLSEYRFVFDKLWMLEPKWVLLKPLTSSPLFLEVGLISYYPPLVNRLKMLGELGEECHFFEEGDHINLVLREEEIISPGKML